MDEWCQQHLQRAFDDGGAWARAGEIHQPLLDALLADEYFVRPPPKSTGRGHFHLAWVHQRFPALNRLATVDVQRTLCELSARSIADQLRRFAPATGCVLLCGGGARNGLLRERLQELLPELSLRLSDEFGLALHHVEAAAFAWLAMRTINNLPGNLPAVTGARRSAVLGGVFRG
jgi:anhydro-N-acetylmuramic acid kinase